MNRNFLKRLGMFLILLVCILAFSYGLQTLRLMSQSGTYIGLITLKGEITSGKARELIDQVRKSQKDKRVGALLLRIDSPGGEVAPSQEIYRSLMKLRGKTKVVVSIGTVGASGGYYVAAAADEIYADPGSITGSIGVLFAYPQVKDLIKKLGIGKVVVKSGKYKDLASPFRPPTSQEREILQELVDDIYLQFVRDVATARKMKESKLKPLADGRIFTGRQACKLGLIDGLMTEEEVMDYISSEVLKVKGRPRVIEFKKHEGWQTLFKRAKGLLDSLAPKRLLWEVK